MSFIGWIQFPYANTDSYSDANSDADSNSNSDADSNAKSESKSNADSNADLLHTNLISLDIFLNKPNPARIETCTACCNPFRVALPLFADPHDSALARATPGWR